VIARNTPAEPFYEMAFSEVVQVRAHDPSVGSVTSPDAPPGSSLDLDGALFGADAVVFAGHKEYRRLGAGPGEEVVWVCAPGDRGWAEFGGAGCVDRSGVYVSEDWEER